ncbi:MAG: hypothetical protein ACREUU_06215 [Gammaproteobacteria bacterium]
MRGCIIIRARESGTVLTTPRGHSTLALTLRIYTHTLAGQYEEAARAAEARLLSQFTR